MNYTKEAKKFNFLEGFRSQPSTPRVANKGSIGFLYRFPIRDLQGFGVPYFNTFFLKEPL